MWCLAFFMCSWEWLKQKPLTCANLALATSAKVAINGKLASFEKVKILYLLFNLGWLA